MFFDLLNTPLKRDVSVRELPPIPDTGWRAPTYFPNLSSAVAISYDTETKEEDFANGPGWGRNKGNIVGVSVAALASNGEQGKWYFPVRHEVERHDNLDPAHVFGWLKHTLETNPCPKIGANLIYDNGWLAEEGIAPIGQFIDVQFAEALIDEQALTALDVLAYKYLRRHKAKDGLKEWIQQAYRSNDQDWRGDIWRAPPRLCGYYGEDDADLPLKLWPYQYEILKRENTLQLMYRECQAIPMIVKIRQQGITIDLAKAEEIRVQLELDIAKLYAKLSHTVGFPFDNVGKKDQLVRAFDVAGIPYPKTAKGAPSFRKEYLASLGGTEDDDRETVASMVNKIREREKLRDTFIDSYILNRAADTGSGNRHGRIYCSFHPLKGDEGGAKTGRWSSSKPNLQNIPARSKLGKLVREAFIPDYGHYCWHKKDHSQIEYRLFAHYAVGRGSDEMRSRYINDPATDYHNDTMIDVAAMRRIDLAAMGEVERDLFRKPIKNVNFGLLYGQTEKSLAYKAGWTDQEATDFFGAYHAGRPFVKSTMDAIQSEVQAFGYVTTILNRRTRFNQWEPVRYADRTGAMAYDMAVRLHGSSIRRAYAYRGVNYRFQGSAADVLKEGMLQCYEQGVYDFIGYPKLQVHDELDWSKRDDTPAMNEAFRYATHVMEQAVAGLLRVPLKVDSTEGKTWGKCK